MKRVKAGALIYVLIITLLGSMIASFFLLYNQLSSQVSYSYFRDYKSERLLESGINYVMASGEILEENKDYFPLEDEPLSVKRKSWGIYSLILSKVSASHKTYTKAVLAGTGIRAGEHPALYVSDLGHPISICGDARIEGKAFIPERGFKRAYIEGQNYIGNQFVYGTKVKSKRDLLSLEEISFNNIRQYLQGNILKSDSMLFTELLPDTIVNSFFNSTLVVEIPPGSKINQGLFSGNIILSCKGKLSIAKSVCLKDCIVFARELELEADNQSHFQAFASQNILLKENSILKYPSVLGIFPSSGELSRKEKEMPSVIMEKNSKMDGSLIAFTKGHERGKEVLVSILENAVLTGEAYSSHLAQVRGMIRGSLYCQQLYLKTSTSLYQNYLLGGKIISTKLPDDFCGLQFTDQHYKKILMDEVE